MTTTTSSPEQTSFHFFPLLSITFKVILRSQNHVLTVLLQSLCWISTIQSSEILFCHTHNRCSHSSVVPVIHGCLNTCHSSAPFPPSEEIHQNTSKDGLFTWIISKSVSHHWKSASFLFLHKMILWYPLFKDATANDNAFYSERIILEFAYEENLNGAFLTSNQR